MVCVRSNEVCSYNMVEAGGLLPWLAVAVVLCALLAVQM